MTAVALPAVPKEASIRERLLDFGAPLNPPLGGASQYVARLGSRFAVDVQLPTLSDSAARAWLAAWLKAKAEGKTLTMSWPQPAAASLGTPLVNGASQAGTVLVADGFTAAATIPALTFFSVVISGRTYLHVVTADTVANGSGQASLPIAPMLRVPPADNAALEMVSPTIEGFIAGNAEWSLDRLKWRSLSFTLAENE